VGKLAGILIGTGVTLGGLLWFYGLMYNWLWVGLINSKSDMWILSYSILFIIFLLLSFPIIIFLILGYIFALMIGFD
jgi:hypothetical protein